MQRQRAADVFDSYSHSANLVLSPPPELFGDGGIALETTGGTYAFRSIVVDDGGRGGVRRGRSGVLDGPAICCSAPICQQEEPPPPSTCEDCDLECVEGEQMSAARAGCTTELAGVRYETDGAESGPPRGRRLGDVQAN